MPTFFMFGKYSTEALKGISSKRTEKGNALIKKMGGKTISTYVLLGEKDLVIIADFPDTGQAMKASIALSKLTGIGFSSSPAMTVEEFDRTMKDV